MINDSEIPNNGPRITPADVEAAIAEEHYFTAEEGVVGRQAMESAPSASHHGSLCLLTFCVLVLRNGFTVTGQSACASPENFNAEIGQRIARQDAVRQIWPLLGYALRGRLSHNERLEARMNERVPA